MNSDSSWAGDEREPRNNILKSAAPAPTYIQETHAAIQSSTKPTLHCPNYKVVSFRTLAS